MSLGLLCSRQLLSNEEIKVEGKTLGSILLAHKCSAEALEGAREKKQKTFGDGAQRQRPGWDWLSDRASMKKRRESPGRGGIVNDLDFRGGNNR